MSTEKSDSIIILSVIIPLYNNEEFVDNLFSMLYRQLTSQIEIIFVDDGSTDNTYSILNDKIINSDSELSQNIILLHQHNQGCSAARQSALNICKGQYITFIDSDDTVADDYFEKFVDIVLNNPDYDIYYTGANVYGLNGELCTMISNHNTSYMSRESFLKDYFLGKIRNMGPLWSHIYNKQFLYDNNICFNPEFTIHSDGFFNSNCILYVNKVYTSDYVGYNWIRRPNSIIGHAPTQKELELNERLEEFTYKISYDAKQYNIKPEIIDEMICSGFWNKYNDLIYRAEKYASGSNKKRIIKYAIKRYLRLKDIISNYRGFPRFFLFLSKLFNSYSFYYLSKKIDKNFFKRVQNKLSGR